MRIIQYDRYGGPEVLHTADVPQPQPGRGEALIRVTAAALNPKDILVRSGKFKRLDGGRFPRSCGYDFSGTLEALGGGADGPALGSAVFGMLNGWRARSCAEWLICKTDEFALLPTNIPRADAAAVPLAGLTALQALRDSGGLKEGQRLLIHGASGGVGTMAVQIGKALGAEVTALCGPESMPLVRSLGADRVFDYHIQPPRLLRERFDVVFDVFGNQCFANIQRQLMPRGCYVTTVPNRQNLLDHLRTRISPLKRARLVVVKSTDKDLRRLSTWLASGAVKPIVAARFPLEEVAAAQCLLAEKHVHGKIIIEIGAAT